MVIACVRAHCWVLLCCRALCCFCRGSPFFPSSFFPSRLSLPSNSPLLTPPNSFVLRPFMIILYDAESHALPGCVWSVPHTTLTPPHATRPMCALCGPADPRAAFPWWSSLFVFVLEMYLGAWEQEIRLFGTCRLCGVLMSSFLAAGAYLR